MRYCFSYIEKTISYRGLQIELFFFGPNGVVPGGEYYPSKFGRWPNLDLFSVSCQEQVIPEGTLMKGQR